MNTEQSHTSLYNSGLRLWLALAIAVLFTLTAGVLYGSYSNRWGPPADLLAAAKQLEKMPQQIGNWKMVEKLSMGETAIQMLECAGYVNRRYINQESGESVTVAIIVGPPGPTAVHTPEVCFSSRAYDNQSERQEAYLQSSAGEHSFWNVDFTSRSPFADKLRVYYAWSKGELWEASSAPRYEFAASPVLYKIQLAVPVPPQQDSDTADTGLIFLKALTNSDWSMAIE